MTKTYKDIVYTSLISLLMLDISKSVHSGNVKTFKTGFKKAGEELLSHYSDTEIEDLVKSIFGDDDSNAEISEELYQYSKTLVLKNNL